MSSLPISVPRLPDWTAVDDALADRRRTVELLGSYFRPVDWSARAVGFDGSWFERFYGGGDRAQVANRFTASNIVSASLLSVHIPARAAWTLATTTPASSAGC